MDASSKSPQLYTFEETIICNAYDLFMLVYTGGLVNPDGPNRINPAKAVEVLSRAYPLFRNEEERADAREYCSGICQGRQIRRRLVRAGNTCCRNTITQSDRPRCQCRVV